MSPQHMSPGMGEFGPGSSPVPDDEDAGKQTAAEADKSGTNNMTSAGHPRASTGANELVGLNADGPFIPAMTAGP